MTDIALHQIPDGGEVTIENGEVLLDDGLATAVYLSLFGGNQDDAGLPGNTASQWWGNCDEPNAARHLRGETQSLIESLPLTTGNLRKLEDAATRDLGWLSAGIASDLLVTASIPKLKTVRLTIRIMIGAKEFRFVFDRSVTK